MDWREITRTQTVPPAINGIGGDFDVAFITCSYCDTKGKFASVFKDVRGATSRSHAEAKWQVYKCNVCANCTFVIQGNDYFGGGEVYTQFLPPIGVRQANRHWPSQPAKYYLQALASLDFKSWDGAVLLSRTAIQSIMKLMNAPAGNLKSQIDSLVTSGSLVQSIAKWAHRIRVLGNEAAHADDESEITESDARQITSLVEYLLQYLYVLPAQIEENVQSQ